MYPGLTVPGVQRELLGRVEWDFGERGEWSSFWGKSGVNIWGGGRCVPPYIWLGLQQGQSMPGLQRATIPG